MMPIVLPSADNTFVSCCVIVPLQELKSGPNPSLRKSILLRRWDCCDTVGRWRLNWRRSRKSAGGFAGEFDAGGLAEIEGVQRLVQPGQRHAFAEHRHADVARLHQHVPQTQRIVAVHIGDVPLEELLFFLVIPTCAVLTLEAVRRTKPSWRLDDADDGA